MNIGRPGSPSATTVAPMSKQRSSSMETMRSRLASERPPKKGVASKNAFRSGELTGIYPIYPQLRLRQDWNQLSRPRHRSGVVGQGRSRDYRVDEARRAPVQR